jgi:methylthioribulose-1-phosphate dehydratase
LVTDGRLLIEGFEMLKGLAGVRTHEHREWLPIIENSQDMEALARTLEEVLERYPDAHGVLLRRHGLYTWGRDLGEAKRHVEILEFLLEVIGRAHFAGTAGARGVVRADV